MPVKIAFGTFCEAMLLLCLPYNDDPKARASESKQRFPELRQETNVFLRGQPVSLPSQNAPFVRLHLLDEKCSVHPALHKMCRPRH